jgi:FKBP-type peptidyl-prolyl cis-trans isomerase
LKWFPFVIAALFVTVACGSKSPTDPSQVTIQFSTIDLDMGTGTQAAAAGNLVNVRYTLWLYNPSGVDNKGDQLQTGTFEFVLGRGQSIAGFDQGVTGMRVGGKRRIYVPANLGYGGNPPANSGIPPNAALVFEVELLELTQ